MISRRHISSSLCAEYKRLFPAEGLYIKGCLCLGPVPRSLAMDSHLNSQTAALTAARCEVLVGLWRIGQAVTAMRPDMGDIMKQRWERGIARELVRYNHLT